MYHLNTQYASSALIFLLNHSGLRAYVRGEWQSCIKWQYDTLWKKHWGSGNHWWLLAIKLFPLSNEKSFDLTQKISNAGSSWYLEFRGFWAGAFNFPRVQYCYTVWIQDQFNNHKVPRKLKLSYNDMFSTIKLEKSSWSAALPISQMYDSMQVSPANCWNSKME